MIRSVDDMGYLSHRADDKGFHIYMTVALAEYI